MGDYSFGLLSADDRAPGLSVAPADPLFKTRSYFNVARINRDVFNQSRVGAIFTDWEYPAANGFNRVGGIDAHLKFAHNWTSDAQAVVSSTRDQFGSYSAGPAYTADLTYSGAHLDNAIGYTDFSPGFVSQPGFVNRVNIRSLADVWDDRFRPESGPVLAWGPTFECNWIYDHTGLRLDTNYNTEMHVSLKRRTEIVVIPYNTWRERLRPEDWPGVLEENRDYHEHASGASFVTTPARQVTFGAGYSFGNAVNFSPATGVTAPCSQPCLARSDSGDAELTLRPVAALRIDNQYLFTRQRALEASTAIFNSHIARSS
jgi:hypothetical protein